MVYKIYVHAPDNIGVLVYAGKPLRLVAGSTHDSRAEALEAIDSIAHERAALRANARQPVAVRMNLEESDNG